MKAPTQSKLNASVTSISLALLIFVIAGALFSWHYPSSTKNNILSQILRGSLPQHRVLAAPAGTTPGGLRAAQQTKRVFVLNSFNRGYTWTDNMLRGIDAAFSASGLQVETYVTFMDMKRVPPTPAYFLQLKELIHDGYKGVKFDAVLACDNDALEFLRKYRDELFPGVPVVFASINDFNEQILDGRKDITGTSENTDYTGTINLALKLLPATKNIVVVIDATTTGSAHRSAVEKIRPNFPQSLTFSYLSLADLTLDELAQKLSALSSDSIVLLLQQFVDKNGTSYTVQQSTPVLTASASVPVFVLTDIRMNLGALGGHVVSGYAHGEAAAQMVVKILSGTDISTIPVLLDSPNKYMFDYSVMQRFKIAESALPAGSILLNKPVSVLDEYRNEIWAILGAFILLCAILVYLLFEIRRRQKIERALTLSRISMEAASDALRTANGRLLSVLESTGDIIAMMDSEYRYTLFNTAFHAEFKQIFGVDIKKGDLMPEALAHLPEDLAHAMENWNRALRGEEFIVTQEFGDKLRERNWYELRYSPIRDSEGKLSGAMHTVRDVTERKQAEMLLRESEQKYRTLVENSGTNIFILDQNGIFQLMNTSGAALFGGKPADFVGKSIFDLNTKAAAEEYFESNRRIIASGVGRVYEKIFDFPIGRKTFIVNEQVIKNAQGNNIALQSSSIDISELKQAEDEIRKLNAELEERVIQRTAQLEMANKELEAFSYSVSHDLRAPLRAIIGYTNILVEDYETLLDTEGKRICGVIVNEAQRMGELIDDLLTFSHLSRKEMSDLKIDMQALLQNVIAELITPEMRERIELQVGELLPAVGDPALIRQVWVNLLSNALKFSSKKERAVIDVGNAPGHTQVETIYFVRDNGAGFDMRYADKLFGVFQRLHSEQEFEGTGVGLAIVQRVILRHGGRVWAESQMDKGAVFYFALPGKDEVE